MASNELNLTEKKFWYKPYLAVIKYSKNNLVFMFNSVEKVF